MKNTVPANKHYRLVKLLEIMTPAHNHIIVLNHWWVVTKNDEVLFFRGVAQANEDKYLADRLCRLSSNDYPDCRLVLVPFACVELDYWE
jgi:hypothetical protein